MTELQAVLLGLVQGLTEFLPVSSSGHLTIFRSLFGIEAENLTFEVAVHAATVLSTIVAFRKEILDLLRGFFKFRMNSQTHYIFKIAVSMIPVMIVGLFFKDYVTGLFGSGLLIVGCMLVLTAILLYLGEKLSDRAALRAKEGASEGKEVGYLDAFIIGLAQSIAVLPGLSRSGTTIATGLMLGVKKSAVAQFSFLMVLVPILGEAFLELISGEFTVAASGISTLALILGFVSAFISGYVACRWMINIVRKAKLHWFSLYCLFAAVACVVIEWLG
ncbi:MAG: undecaprenyl-diphosphate phosphatase [Candidatus Coprenecus sp.]|nr:undecaprenyl-diphosphate phosphatase [Candidatus Coprenecus sp.]